MISLLTQSNKTNAELCSEIAKKRLTSPIHFIRKVSENNFESALADSSDTESPVLLVGLQVCFITVNVISTTSVI